MAFSPKNDSFREKSSKNTIPIGSLVLDLPPSCIEFVPPSPKASWPDRLFVVGTYDLQKEEKESHDGFQEDESNREVAKEQSRQGSLSLYKLKDDVLTELQTFSTPSAILDLHFFPGTTIFAVASSTGTISFFGVVTEIEQENSMSEIKDSASTVYKVVELASHQILDTNTIITYFTWDANSTRDSPRMAITSTTGSVMTIIFNQTFTTFEIENEGETINQHDFEAWCCAFSNNGNALYSGGDDGKLIVSSLDSFNPATRRLPFHNAGVTMILPIPQSDSLSEEPELLLTGSYDDFIRVYQPPSLYSTKPQVLAEKDIGCSGGGVWRLKFFHDYSEPRPSSKHDTTTKRTFLVVASCMRVGCKILEIKESNTGEWTIDVLAKTAVHESMNYASDIVPLAERDEREADGKRTVVSTSFYDRLLFVWKYDPSVIIDVVLE